MKNFNEWNEVKKSTEDEHNIVGFRDRDVFYIKMGQDDFENMKNSFKELLE